jgi:hypothetical protein
VKKVAFFCNPASGDPHLGDGLGNADGRLKACVKNCRTPYENKLYVLLSLPSTSDIYVSLYFYLSDL